LEIPIPNRRRRDRTELVELEELIDQFLMKEQKIEKREEKKNKIVRVYMCVKHVCVYMVVGQAYVWINVSNNRTMAV